MSDGTAGGSESANLTGDVKVKPLDGNDIAQEGSTPSSSTFVFSKYPKIYTIGHEENKEMLVEPSDLIVLQEKIDGGNFRFYITKEGKIIIGSRTQQLTSNDGEDTNMNKMFQRCSDFVRTKLSAVAQESLLSLSKLIFYGENCVKHTMTYDFQNMPPFLGFDIYDTEKGKFLPFPIVTGIYERLGMEMVPTLGVHTTEEIKEMIAKGDAIVPKSKYALPSAKDQRAEGVVFKNYMLGIFAKYVRDEFKEANAEAFGGSPKYNKVDDTNNAEFLFKYCTNARIEKLVFKMLDEGKKLDMSLMGDLIRQTYKDIIAENWQEILESNWKLDFKGCRQLIAPRCRSVLQQIITNNALK